MARLSEESVAEQIGKLKGNVSAVGRAFGVTRQAVSAFIGRHPALAGLLKDAREEMVDNVESRFYADCLKDDPSYQTSRIFFLKTQGKARGYVEKLEVEATGTLEVYEEIVDGHRAKDGPAAPGPG